MAGSFERANSVTHPPAPGGTRPTQQAPQVTFFFLLIDKFLEQFQVYSKMEQKLQRCPEQPPLQRSLPQEVQLPPPGDLQ